MLRYGANKEAPVQKAKAPRPGARVWCTSIMSVHHPRGSPSTLQDYSQRAKVGTDTFWLTCTASPSDQRCKSSHTTKHRQWAMSRWPISPTTLESQGNCTVTKADTLHNSSLHPQQESMVECYVNTVQEHMRKVIWMHYRDWNKKLPSFLLAYKALPYDTTA
jgi:hypothetical protein